MSEADDLALVRLCLDGDPGAFEGLVDRYQKVLFNVALRMLQNREDAMDATQTAFIKAYEKLGTFDPTFKFFSWIYKILVNESLNLLARRKPMDEIDSGILSPGKTPEDEHAESRVQNRVRSAVLQLPIEYQRVIVLRHFGNLSYRAMSEAMDLPEKTVKSRLFTARRLLRDLLIDQGVAMA